MSRKPTKQQQYKNKNAYLAANFEQVTPREFFRDVFPEGWLERKGHPEDRKPNAVFGVAYPKPGAPTAAESEKLIKNEFGTMLQDEYNKYCASTSNPVSFAKFKKSNTRSVRYALRKKYRRLYVENKLIFDGLEGLEDVLRSEGAEFVITSPVTFSGRKHISENAYHLWGIAIDLDGVTLPKLENLHYQIQNKVLPCPTFLVNSGTGLHVWYLFEEPIPLFRHLHRPLTMLKKGLTEMVWNAYTSALPVSERQFQGIWQGFRCPGSPTKLGRRYPVTAFRVGEKGTLTELNSYVADEYKIDFNDITRVTLDEARQKWPEWHEKRVIRGEARGTYTQNIGMYKNWIKHISRIGFQGNRYWCIAMLAVNAIKCDVPFEDLHDDALMLFPLLNRQTKDVGEEFTISDVYDALGFYQQSFKTYPVHLMEFHTHSKLPRQKRNGRKQAEHIKLMNYVRDEINQNANWRDGNGRPAGSGTAQDKILEWRADHPEGTKKQCKDETGLTYPTIRKWWDTVKTTPERQPGFVYEDEFDLDLDNLHVQAAKKAVGDLEDEK